MPPQIIDLAQHRIFSLPGPRENVLTYGYRKVRQPTIASLSLKCNVLSSQLTEARTVVKSTQ